MKEKKIIFLLFATLCLCTSVWSDEVVALKNNVLYDATMTPNLAVEVKLHPQWSMEVGAGFNPFPLDDTKFPKWRHVSAWPTPETRFNPKPTEKGSPFGEPFLHIHDAQLIGCCRHETEKEHAYGTST